MFKIKGATTPVYSANSEAIFGERRHLRHVRLLVLGLIACTVIACASNYSKLAAVITDFTSPITVPGFTSVPSPEKKVALASPENPALAPGAPAGQSAPAAARVGTAPHSAMTADPTSSARLEPSTPVQNVAPKPVIVEKPSAANTGPRYSLLRTLSPDAAMAELKARKYLSRVHITGGIKVEAGWVIEDVKISGSSLYMVQTNNTPVADQDRPILRYADISGSGSSSGCVLARYIVIRYSNIYACRDIIKLQTNTEITNSFAHSMYGVEGGHHDTVQITNGKNMVVRNNTLIGNVAFGYGAPKQANGVLQTGSLQGDVENVQFIDNWVDGGGYTLRGDGATAGDGSVNGSYSVKNYMFKGNKFGLSHSFGPIAYMGPRTYFDASNVWEVSGTTAKRGTVTAGQPVRSP